jgi:hypothetical protein
MGVSVLNKEVPYLVTVLVAILAWSITHIADRVVTSPTVEFSLRAEKSSSGQTIKVTLRNLSDRSFVNLRFELQGNNIRPCSRPMVFEPPAWASSSGPEQGTDAVAFQVSQLQPGWTVILCGSYQANDQEPLFVLKSSQNNQAIMLRRPGLATWILRFETALIATLAIAAALAIAVWLAAGRGRG